MKNSSLTINRARALTGYQPMGGPKPSPPKTGSGVGAPPRPSLDPNWVPTPGGKWFFWPTKPVAISVPRVVSVEALATVALGLCAAFVGLEIAIIAALWLR